MSTPLTFSRMPYERPDPADAALASARHVKALRAARDAAEAAAAVQAFDGEERKLSTLATLARVRFQQDTRDPAARGEAEFFDQAGPDFLDARMAFLTEAVGSPHRPELEARFGSHVFAIWSDQLRAYDKAIAEESRETARLGMR